MAAAEGWRRNVVAVRGEFDVGKRDVFEPDFLQASAAIAVLIAGGPASVYSFQHLLATLIVPTTQGRFCVKMNKVQIAGGCAVVSTHGETDRFRRRVFIAKNKLVAAVAQGWGKHVEQFERSRAKIPGTGMPNPGGHGLADLRTGQRVGQLLADVVVQSNCEGPGTGIASIGRNQEGRDERLPAGAEGDLQALVAGKRTLRWQSQAKPGQGKQQSQSPKATRNRKLSKYRHRMRKRIK